MPCNTAKMSHVQHTNTNLPSMKDATYEPLGAELFQLALSPENKVEIFEYALSSLSSSQEESARVMQNLQKWDPSVASLFTRRSLATILDTPFRLIFPNSALQSFDETGLYVRQYIAVSYCWTSPEFLPDGYKKYGDWPISKPFVDAILEDKDHPREGIWMDQLCIDQNSTEDKMKSVAAMDVIYKSCIRLIVLLEDVTLDTIEIELVEKHKSGSVRVEKVWNPGTREISALVSFYEKVNRARWWTRAWCFHEFNVNEPWSDKRKYNEIHNATFILGAVGGKTIKMKWSTLHGIMVEALSLVVGEVGDVLTAFKGQSIFNGVGRIKDGGSASLMAKYNGVADKGCLHMSDRLSIMINMCGLGLAYAGGAMKSMEDFLYVGVLLALAAGEAYPMTTFDMTRVPPERKSTWLNHRAVAEFLTVPRFKANSLDGIHRVTPQKITLDMVFFGNNLELIDSKSIRATYDMFPGTIPTTLPERQFEGRFISVATLDHPDTTYDVVRRPFLAGCISNGYKFVSRFWAQIKRDVIATNYNTGNFKDLAPNPDFAPAALTLLKQLLPVTSLLCLPPPEEFTMEDASLFLTWITDPRSIFYMIFAENLKFGQQQDDFAFVSNIKMYEEFQKEPRKNLRLAIPKDLLGHNCMGLRVWVLQPRAEGKWRLVGKALLLGEGDLEKGLSRKPENNTARSEKSNKYWIEKATVEG